MINFIHKQDIKTTYVDKVSDKTPGLYIIDFEDKKRNISYWRESSAARELFLTRSLHRIGTELLDFDLIYFSAITLAIMSEEGRNNFFRIVKKARLSGVKIAFDPKFRPSLYKSNDQARKIYEQAIHYSDIFLPSIEDEKKLWEEENTYSVIEKAKKAGCSEIIIKCGKEDIVYYYENFTKTIKTKAVSNIVDKTAAGDSFNGAYLASRLKGKNIEKSIKKAKKLASKVIMSKGAIISKQRKSIVTQ